MAADVHPLKVNFGEALDALKQGKRARRLAWPTHHYLQLDWPGGKATPAISIWGKARVTPWQPEHADLLAVDWVVLT